MAEYDHDRTVYATSPEEQGEVSTGTGEEYDEVWHDPNWLHTQYHALGKNQREIAEECDISGSTVRYWMEKHGIESRDRGKAASIALGGDSKVWDEEWLRREYCEERRPTADIAEELNIDRSTVSRALERHGIETRDPTNAQDPWVESEFGDEKYNNEKWLKHQYVTLGKSTGEIAEENGWGESSVRRAAERHGIKMRSYKAAGLNWQKGEKCSPEGSDRELVSGNGIDATWRDIQDRDQSCYIQYRDPAWLQKQVDKGKTDREMVEECNVDCHIQTLRKWRRRFGIDRDETPAEADD